MRQFFFAVLYLPLRWRFLIWLCYVLCWTTALLVPQPVSAGGDEAKGMRLFLFAKTVHISAFAVLAILSGWLGANRRLRWYLLAFLILHAGGTEYLQYIMDVGRIGCWRDVWLNLIGITLGIAVSWKWWWSEHGVQPAETLSQ